MKQYEKKTIIKKILRFLMCSVTMSLVVLNSSIVAKAATNTAGEMAVFPGVTISPDGTAWTTDYMDKTNEKLPEGYTISTGQTSGLRELNAGEHYYQTAVEGSINISKWVVAWQDAQCIHYFEAQNYKGFQTAEGICEKYYNNGWNAYCADCGEIVTDMYIYARSDTVKGILSMPAQSSYVYLCPHCQGLEQGTEYHHVCKEISYNHYEISYEKNAPSGTEVSGYMAVTKHMYNNAAVYEGIPVDKKGYTDTKLRKNSYECEGYVFVGWNTEADGTGEFFADGQAVINLSGVEGGTVKLYAQWELADSTFVVDANGGTYAGEEQYFVTQDYKTTYKIDNSLLIPAAGYTVSFETNGGSVVEDIITNKELSYWEVQKEMKGSFRDNVYTFPAIVGNVDTVKAQYTDVSFILPNTKKENESLVGWYKDVVCTEEAFVGRPGGEIIVSGDMTLYAKWARLTLWAYDDYVAHDGVGAVDLVWEQKDGQSKYYKLYQSPDQKDWSIIYAGDSIQKDVNIEEYFGADLQGKQLVIEQTGYYKLTAAGAKGADYDEMYAGGNGGSVSAEYWLEKGDMLTFYAGTSGSGIAGGNNGSEASGGDSTSDLGSGGGAATEIYVTRDGIRTPLLIAGGGGGASDGSSGGNGGNELTEPGDMQGKSSDYGGGGGGAQGGVTGSTYYQTTIDSPDKEDVAFMSEWSSTFPSATQIYSVWKSPQNNSSYPIQYMDYALKDRYMNSPRIEIGGLCRDIEISSTDATNDEYHHGRNVIQAPSENTPPSYNCYQSSGGFVRKYSAVYPTKGNTNVVASGMLDAWGNNAISGYIRFRIWDADSNLVLHDETYVDGVSYVNTSDNTASWSVGAWGDFNVEGIENVCVEVLIYGESIEAHFNTKVLDTFFYGKKIGMATATAGGSSYINSSFGCKNEEYSAGTNDKDGYAQVESTNIGFSENTELEDVLARDEAAPDMVEAYEISRADENEVIVTLTQPEDFGTVYYHKVESYKLEDAEVKPVAISNITANTLTTGVNGYYYYVDAEPEGIVTKNHFRTDEGKISVTITEEVLYLHVAAVDVAGNLGATQNIELRQDEKLPEDDVFPESRKLFTEQLQVEDTEFVYQAEDKIYFVKADDETEHILLANAGLYGAATQDYQVDSVQFNVGNDTYQEWLQTTIPHGDIAHNNAAFSNDSLSMNMSENGLMLLQPGPALAERKNHAIQVELAQTFTVNADTPVFQIYPQAIAEFKDKIYYSEEEKDINNGLTIIPDGTPPVIEGLEELQELDVLDMTEETKQFVLRAHDSLSGLQEFIIYINNRDNRMKEEVVCNDEGEILLEIDKDNPLFIGDISISAIAVDRVDNATVIGEESMTFTLETNLYRERNPEENVFKTGDGAVLDIFTSGYVECVEVIFPEELLAVNPDLNCSFEYENPALRKQETLKFSIPLGVPEQEYELTVKAYKKGQMLISKPTMVVVEGNVLDELRTRIRNNG